MPPRKWCILYKLRRRFSIKRHKRYLEGYLCASMFNHFWNLSGCHRQDLKLRLTNQRRVPPHTFNHNIIQIRNGRGWNPAPTNHSVGSFQIIVGGGFHAAPQMVHSL